MFKCVQEFKFLLILFLASLGRGDRIIIIYVCLVFPPSYATHVLQVTTLELNIVQCLQDFNVKKSYIPP